MSDFTSTIDDPTKVVAPPESLQLPPLGWDLDRFRTRILVGEGSDRYAVSPKGAMGNWQVMPDTARKPGFGIAPASDLSNVNELNRVGYQYAEAMFNKYGQNPTMGAIAYNWGPGNLDKLIGEIGDPRKGQVSWETFVSRLPAETQDYLIKVAGGDLALRGQRPPVTKVTATPENTPLLPKRPNELAMQQGPNFEDMKKQFALMMLQSLLPKNLGLHPVDYDPKVALQRPLQAPRITEGLPNLVQAPRVVFGNNQAAYGPGLFQRLGQKGPRE